MPTTTLTTPHEEDEVDELERVAEQHGKARQRQREASTNFCCCSRSCLRTMRSWTLASLMAVSVAVAAVCTEFALVPPYGTVTDRSVLIDYPCNTTTRALSYTLPRAGGNLSAELRDVGVVVFEFPSSNRVWHKSALALNVPGELLHFVSVAVLRNDAVRVKVLYATPCTEALVKPFEAEVAAYLFERARGYEATLIDPHEATHSHPIRCSLSAPGSGGLEVAPGAFEVCRGEPRLLSPVEPLPWEVLIFFACEALLALALLAYVVVNLKAVRDKWFVVYVLHIVPEFHLVRLTFLGEDRTSPEADEMPTHPREALLEKGPSKKIGTPIGTFVAEVLEGSHGDNPNFDRRSSSNCCTTYAAMRAFPLCRCCCKCCEEDGDRRQRKGTQAEQFLTHLLTDVVRPLEVCDFVVSDPIQCDSHCWSAFVSSCLHAAIGIAPHVPLIVATCMLGCTHGVDTLPGDNGYPCEGGAQWYQYALLGLIAAQSIACAPPPRSRERPHCRPCVRAPVRLTAPDAMPLSALSRSQTRSTAWRGTGTPRGSSRGGLGGSLRCSGISRRCWRAGTPSAAFCGSCWPSSSTRCARRCPSSTSPPLPSTAPLWSPSSRPSARLATPPRSDLSPPAPAHPLLSRVAPGLASTGPTSRPDC